MVKVRLIAPINVNEHEIPVAEGTEGILLAEQGPSCLEAFLAGVTTEAVIALPNECVDDEQRAILTSEVVVTDIDAFFNLKELTEKCPEGYFLSFVVSLEYEHIN